MIRELLVSFLRNRVCETVRRKPAFPSNDRKCHLPGPAIEKPKITAPTLKYPFCPNINVNTIVYFRRMDKDNRKELREATRIYSKSTVRHVVTSDKFHVKDVIQTNKGIALVLQALKDESTDARHRIFTVPLEMGKKDYELEG
jgi:hypothetical protein